MTAALALAAALLAAAPPLPSEPGAPAGAPAPPGRTLRVGSKQFTESVVLGELASRLLAAEGIPAEHRSALGGTRVAWEALLAGAIDLYPEYTGTLARELLAAEAPAGRAALDAALARRGLAATGSLGFENGYALGMRRADAARLGIARISDLARHPRLRLGLTNEFVDRADGWALLRARYGLPHAPRALQHELAYRALAAGELDVVDLYSTDPEIRRLELLVLEDDRRAFPEYAAVLLHRADLPEAAVAALRRLEGRISAAEMIGMNARAQLDRAPAAEVAADFLRERLGAGAPPAGEAGLAARIWLRTREHLAMVAVALAGAIAAGVPLGVLAARRPGLGRAVLGLSGLVQTVPSLALLVLLLPALGIGARPAIAALFLYGLLPIVRNTHAGLAGIAPELREAAAAIGLPPRARLWRVELPLAAPSILAGVRTAAVIAVGTATLGALVGAGGHGVPILAGVRLVSTPLLLEGALPAAALALLAEAAFEGLERLLVSPGLRGGRRP